MTRRPLPVLAATLSLLVVAACSTSTASTTAAGTTPVGGYPVTVTNCGREVTVDATPERVLLGYASVEPTLDALGVGDRAFGYLSGSSHTEPSDLQEVSPDFYAAREAVLASRPDLVLVGDENQISGEQGTPGVEDLAAIGADAYVLGGYCLSDPAPTTIERVYSDVRELGSIFGVPDRAEEVVTDLSARVTAAGALRGEREPVSVAFVQSYDGALYALSGSYYNAVLQGAGLVNEFADITGNFAEISPEQVLVRRPEVVFAVYPGSTDPQVAVSEASAALAGSTAVLAGRVTPVAGVTFEGGGVGIVDLIEDAATAVYGG